MRKAMKIKGKQVEAWELGSGSEMEKSMLADGKICLRQDGSYEIFSQEATGGVGEIAQLGDYFKVDGSGYPYPNAKAWFLDNHRHLEGDCYEQMPKPLIVWEATEEMNEGVRWLLDHGRMRMDEADQEHYFQAFLWGADLSAPKDALVIFYEVIRDEKGEICDISFNFIAREEFDRDYRWV